MDEADRGLQFSVSVTTPAAMLVVYKVQTAAVVGGLNGGFLSWNAQVSH